MKTVFEFDMKNTIFTIFVLTIFIISARAADVFPLKVERVAPDALKVANVADAGYVTLGAYYTPDGKYLVVAASGEFAVLRAENLAEKIANLDRARAWKGTPSEYLPSGKIVFSTTQGIYALDPVAEKIQTIYELRADEIDPESYYLDWNMIVMSDDLIIAGDGDSGDGSPDGNILRFDVNRKRRTRGAPIAGFYNPQLSPSRRFVLFEHGNGLDTEYADIYDLRRERAARLAARFNLRRAFPKYKKIKIRPVRWVGENTFLAEVEKLENNREISDATYTSADSWIVLLDAATGKIVWKVQPKISFGATSYAPLGAGKMLVDTTDAVYELSLADGKIKPLPGLEGQSFAPSPDKKKAAYFKNLNELYVSGLDGTQTKKILELPKAWNVTRWALRPPLWSPDGKHLIVFSEKEFLFVNL
jgi:hypothetical protein